MGRYKGEGRVTTSVTISPRFFELARKYNLNFSEATRIGISIMLGDLGIEEYDNTLNLHKKMKLYRQQLEEKSEEVERLNTWIEQHENNNEKNVEQVSNMREKTKK